MSNVKSTPFKAHTGDFSLSTPQMRVVDRVLAYWQVQQTLSSAQCIELRDSITISRFDWYRFVQIAFLVSGVFASVTFVYLFDTIFHQFLKHLTDFNMGILFAIFYLVFTVAGYRWDMDGRIYRIASTVMYFLAVLMGYLAVPLFIPKSNVLTHGFISSSFLLFWVYAFTACVTGSAILWTCGLLSLGSWIALQPFAKQCHYETMLVYGVLLLSIAPITAYMKRKMFSVYSFLVGLIYVFVSLWVISLTGGMLLMYVSYPVAQCIWATALLIVSCLATWCGLRYDWLFMQEFGLTFIAFACYSKYIEYGWSALPKSIFFGLLAISFWLLGRYAQPMVRCLSQYVKSYQSQQTIA